VNPSSEFTTCEAATLLQHLHEETHALEGSLALLGRLTPTAYRASSTASSALTSASAAAIASRFDYAKYLHAPVPRHAHGLVTIVLPGAVDEGRSHE